MHNPWRDFYQQVKHRGETPSEKLQISIFQWLRESYPDLPAWHTLPNTKKNTGVLTRNKLIGVPLGVPHIFIAQANIAYHGFFATLKTGKNIETTNERLLRKNIEENKFYCCVNYSVDDFKQEWLKYLGER